MAKNVNQRSELKLIADKNWKYGPELSMANKGCIKYHSKGVFYLEWKFLGSHQ